MHSLGIIQTNYPYHQIKIKFIATFEQQPKTAKSSGYGAGRFFILEDDGYHQARCDEEIAEYKKKQEVASNAGKASANARKKKAEQDENNQQANDEHHINDRSTAVQQEINDRSTTVQPTNNHKPITNNIYTHTNAREQNFCSLADWQPPPMQEMQSELLRAGVNVTLNASQYQITLQDFKAYYDNQATLGKPLNTDFVRRQKFRQWLSRSDSKTNESH